jgi:4-aminobutyrate aminotransferase-like enzyme
MSTPTTHPAGMSSKDMIDACMKHSLFSWSATGKVDPIPVTRAEGTYLYGPEGQRWIDWNSQLMHNPPLCIKEAQMAEGFGIIDRALDLVDEVFEG